jgi:hypothetical protein
MGRPGARVVRTEDAMDKNLTTATDGGGRRGVHQWRRTVA